MPANCFNPVNASFCQRSSTTELQFREFWKPELPGRHYIDRHTMPDRNGGLCVVSNRPASATASPAQRRFLEQTTGDATIEAEADKTTFKSPSP